jgi:hypothetical protein
MLLLLLLLYNTHLIEVPSQQCPHHCGWFHHQDQVPVNERPVKHGVPPAAVGNEVGEAAAQDCDVAECDCLGRRESCRTAGAKARIAQRG